LKYHVEQSIQTFAALDRIIDGRVPEKLRRMQYGRSVWLEGQYTLKELTVVLA
jgi:hypothetical protein